MFDGSFGELGLILVVALVVFGPEQLPQVIRSIVKYISVARTMTNNIKREISHELQLSNLKESIEVEQKQVKKVSETIKATQHHFDTTKEDIGRSLGEVRSELESIKSIFEAPSNK
ncbi:Sec-independent protein translocase protein TatB [Vibrio marisflavi]|uniref:Sec-independent protein translocase protein TatB n=1 Tax=Vibrio marisflavi CECT 7928 TaxID=634439 RepID=A0ABM8ZZU3_9VIBR|nr:Sec-independent protein translocase protein TatB [Vibrio marisflavi]CAH0536670.1 Sec-independent protein translocase protein TatB [Vibrio marisflavi CECT 7928]